MKPPVPTFDASTLPNVVYSHRGLVWWGTLGFIVIEGFTLALCAVTYLYLRKNFVAWPPGRTVSPDLLVPTISLVVLLAGNIPALLAKKRAEHLDVNGTRLWMTVVSVVGVAVLGLRLAEFWSLNTQWNTNAYGSIIWTILGLHYTLLLGDVFDSIGLTAILYSDKYKGKHIVGATDGALYWMFVSLAWVPLYVLVYLGPRIL